MMESQESLHFNYMLPGPAIPKPCHVQHERNIEVGIMFCGKFVQTLCC